MYLEACCAGFQACAQCNPYTVMYSNVVTAIDKILRSYYVSTGTHAPTVASDRESFPSPSPVVEYDSGDAGG